MKKSTIAKLLVICLIVGLMGSSFAATAVDDAAGATATDDYTIAPSSNGTYTVNIGAEGAYVTIDDTQIGGYDPYAITLAENAVLTIDDVVIAAGGSLTVKTADGKVLYRAASGVALSNVKVTYWTTTTPSGAAARAANTYYKGWIMGDITLKSTAARFTHMRALDCRDLDVDTTLARYTAQRAISGSNYIWSVKSSTGTKVPTAPSTTTTPANTVKPGGFTDVVAGSWYADAVAWAVAKGITTGTSETTFSPNASCSRAEMVTFLWRLAGSPAASGTNPFTDVAAGSWYYDAVMWAVANNVTTGTSATTFSPTAIVDRAQSVTLLYRYAGQPTVETTSSFGDVPAGVYYADAVNWAAANGVTTGTSSTTFSPNDACSRAQIVTFMYRYAGQD